MPARAHHTQSNFVDEHGTRFWARCTFQGIRDDPVDQFLFVYLGGALREVGGRICDMWYSPEKREHCECAAPASMLGSGSTVVEIGANDGVHMANSYFFEQHLGWRSLCVEANPITFSRLVRNRPRCINVNALVGVPEATLGRKAATSLRKRVRDSGGNSGGNSDGGSYSSSGGASGGTSHASSQQPWPLVPFISISRPLGTEKAKSHSDWETGLSGIEGSGHKEISSLKAAQAYAAQHSVPYAPQLLVANRTLLPLRPFSSIFEEHSIRVVDVLFLDVEGAELAVLRSIDFDAVEVRVIVAEVIHPTELVANSGDSGLANGNESSSAPNEVSFTPRGRAITNFLAAKGYRRLGLSFRLGDSIFVRSDADGGRVGASQRVALMPPSKSRRRNHAAAPSSWLGWLHTWGSG